MKKLVLVLLGLLLAGLMAQASPNLIIDSFSYDPTPASPGTNLSVWVQIKNDSPDDAVNASVTINLDDTNKGRSSFPFSMPEADKMKIVNVKAYSSTVLKYSIAVDPQAINGDYTIYVSAGQVFSTTRKVSQVIHIVTRRPQVEIIEAPKMEQQPGSIFQLPITIKNVGSSSASNIFIGAYDSQSTDTVVKSLGNSLQFLEKLEVGESKIVTLDLSVDHTASAKTYSVPISIKWQDELRSDFNTTRNVGIRIVQNPEIDTGLGEIKLVAGSANKVEVNVDIFNRGSSTAKNVIIQVESENAQLLSSDKVFIGTLESDDFDSFKLTLMGKDFNSSQLKLAITYANNNDEVKTVNQTVEVPLLIISENKNQNGFDYVGALVILVILLVVGNFAYQKYFKKKKD